jgi:hypothetical protein
LIIGQTKHVPDDNPERPFAENTGRDIFAPMESRKPRKYTKGAAPFSQISGQQIR